MATNEPKNEQKNQATQIVKEQIDHQLPTPPPSNRSWIEKMIKI